MKIKEKEMRLQQYLQEEDIITESINDKGIFKALWKVSIQMVSSLAGLNLF